MFCRHAGEKRHAEVFAQPGFRVAPAIARVPGMTASLALTL